LEKEPLASIVIVELKNKRTYFDMPLLASDASKEEENTGTHDNLTQQKKCSHGHIFFKASWQVFENSQRLFR
jgi:hypothetical protein